jgi:LysM repeat protein
MNTPNPLVPQGSLQEQSKRKSQVRIIVFSILAIHVVLLGALLTQTSGCRREEPAGPKVEPPPTSFADTNLVPPPPLTSQNTQLPAPPSVIATDAPPPVVNHAVEPTPGTPTEHLIAKGDTFASLAKKYGVSVKAIQQANPGVDSSKLKIKQKIIIPAKPPGGAASPTTSSSRTAEPEVGVGETLYTVKKGDTLTKIAKANSVSVKAIRAANTLRTDQLREGQKLKLPAKGSASAEATAASVPPAPAPVLTSAPAVTPGP